MEPEHPSDPRFTRDAPALFNAYADRYRDRFMDVTVYAPFLQLALADLPENARVLDLGCGPANLSFWLAERAEGLQVTGLDLAENMLDLARLALPSGNFLYRDARDLSGISGQFDVVLCGFILPYIAPEDAVALLQDAAGLLVPGGTFFLSAYAGDPAQSRYLAPSSGDGPSLWCQIHDPAILAATLAGASLHLVDQDSLPGHPVEEWCSVWRRDVGPTVEPQS